MAGIIKKKQYYKISFELASPLAVGSGNNENTDKDLIKDAKGIPYIPASSLAGVIRDILSERDNAKTEVDKCFGKVVINTGKGENLEKEESRIIFYDAYISSGVPRITVRDSVALDQCKTAKKGAKFDMEVLEPGVTFTTFIEQNYLEESDKDYGDCIANVFASEEPVFGGKSMRGYGSIMNVSINEKSFDLSTEAEKWLDFDLYDSQAEWNAFVITDNGNDHGKEISLTMKLNGGISIRRYTTKVSKGETSEPDMEQLTIGADEIPVIPGTSWAGAISHRMEEFGIKKEERGSIFGFVAGDGKDSKARSKISFSETRIKDAKSKVISRNAIDRFTGGTVDGALYTERTYYGGSTVLRIGWHDKEAIPENEKKALAAALTDLHYGILAVGGETSVGRGIFTISKVNEVDIPEAKPENSGEVFGKILSVIEEVFK